MPSSKTENGFWSSWLPEGRQSGAPDGPVLVCFGGASTGAALMFPTRVRATKGTDEDKHIPSKLVPDNKDHNELSIGVVSSGQGLGCAIRYRLARDHLMSNKCKGTQSAITFKHVRKN